MGFRWTHLSERARAQEVFAAILPLAEVDLGGIDIARVTELERRRPPPRLRYGEQINTR